jgi:putative PIN family toxin of toxin-antitoxin system
MRLGVDTNVFVSAALKQSSWSAATFRWIESFDGLLKSAATEEELLDVLRRPRIAGKLPGVFLDRVRRILAEAEAVAIMRRIPPVCRDPDDDRFLELALNGGADVIVSGDHDLLAVGKFAEMPIVTPAAFIQAWV